MKNFKCRKCDSTFCRIDQDGDVLCVTCGQYERAPLPCDCSCEPGFCTGHVGRWRNGFGAKPGIEYCVCTPEKVRLWNKPAIGATG